MSNKKDCPFLKFRIWLNKAIDADVKNYNAMCLSTCNMFFEPSSRIVLLKFFNKSGFIFFSNYLSRKGQEIKFNKNVSLLFFWDKLGKQVRIEGRVKKLLEHESELYYHSRPIESRLSAWASKQSCRLKNQKILYERMNILRKKFSTKKLIRPKYWGGYIVTPRYFEFWSEKPSRLHKRIIYNFNYERKKWYSMFLYP